MKKLNCHPYPTRIWFTQDKDEFNRKTLKLIGDTGAEDNYTGCCAWNSQTGEIVIGVFDSKLTTLVHELGHAMLMVFAYVCMPVNFDTEEAYCYLLESLFGQCCSQLTKV